MELGDPLAIKRAKFLNSNSLAKKEAFQNASFFFLL
jgi:hypothetical protein